MDSAPATLVGMADALRTDLPGIGRYRRLAAVDVPDPKLSLVERFTRSRWLWTSVVVLLMGIGALVRMYVILSPDTKVANGTIPGLNSDALWTAWKYALPTLAVWSVVFLLVDRWRHGSARALVGQRDAAGQHQGHHQPSGAWCMRAERQQRA